ncbi:MAG: hypothetical protein H5T86_08570 [Armatimonadetes bacterium]|nr:hypothetical protein [Armatimonadota bacterium]
MGRHCNGVWACTVALVAVALLAGCSAVETDEATWASRPGYATVRVHLEWPDEEVSSACHDIPSGPRVRITVTGPDLEYPVYHTQYFETDERPDHLELSVKCGEQRHFLAEVFNNSGDLVLRGEAEADVPCGRTTAVTVVLRP